MPLLVLSALALLASTAQSASSLQLANDAAHFERRHSGARLVRAGFGGLEHASGFAAKRLAAGDEQNARLFLVQEGASFGIRSERDLETVRVSGTRNRGGVALFRRLVDDLPVFGGEIAVVWRRDGAVTAVSGSRALATESVAPFSVDAAQAREAALSTPDQGFPGGPASETRGWIEFDGRLLPVWRVSYETVAPRNAFTAFVDGDTGRFLYRVSRRSAASVLTYKDSPLEPDASDPVLLESSGLPAGAQALRSDRVEVFNCKGLDEASVSTTSCPHLAAPDSLGNFVAPPDLTFVDVEDAFAEQSAYFHADAHSRFLDSLDPALAARQNGSIVGFVNAFVNVTSGGAPYDNAYYQSPDPTSPPGTPGILVCGQGTHVDFAYDGEIIFHELSHRAVEVTAGFQSVSDRFGFDQDPSSLNEGTADTLSFLNPESGDPCIAKYVGAAFDLACLRDADNRKTCRGNGSNDGGNPGRDGEVHDDGEIWLGFTWAVWSAARAQGLGLEKPMSVALFRALESMGSRPSFEAYAQSVRQASLDVISADPYFADSARAAADFVECTIAERDLAGCSDRSVPLFSGERAQGIIAGFTSGSNPAPQQYFVDVPCEATGLHLHWGTDLGNGALYVRYGEPITFLLPGAGPQFDWVLESNEADALLSQSPAACAACSTCKGMQTPFGPGRWYLLPAGAANSIFTVGISLDMPEGVPAPVRTPYLFGDGVHNVCTWGAGTEPANRVLPVPVEPPSLACEPPQPPGTLPSSCPPTGASAVIRAEGRGCTCGGPSPDAAVLAALCLLAMRRRRRGRSG